ncbi:MAG: phosphate/phosphite/phosphonate ABC transporter substrate-binding protein [Chromatiales bacterium]|nr:phosphate/phosphite/phosphonate ABC transporter substrate-binding protein [Chromatiales bacterium]
MTARRSPTGTSARARMARMTGLLLLAAGGLAAAAEPLTLALVPQSPPAVMHRQWSPLAERVAVAAGVGIRLRIYSSFPAFEGDAAAASRTSVYQNPYQQLVAHKARGYIPLVRGGAQPLTGVLVVPYDSPVRSLDDLNGADIAFPHPTAFAASLYMRALLHDKEKIRFRAHYLSTHGNVYRHVILGRMVAGGGVNKTLERELPETRRALRVLYVTPADPVAPAERSPARAGRAARGAGAGDPGSERRRTGTQPASARRSRPNRCVPTSNATTSRSSSCASTATPQIWRRSCNERAQPVRAARCGCHGA